MTKGSADTHEPSIVSSEVGGLLDKARARVSREKELLTSADTAHYAPASLGQSPYVALPAVGGTVVLRKCHWGC